MELGTLQNSIEAAAARGLGVELLIGSERVSLLPLSVRAMESGELEIRATGPTFRNSLPPRPDAAGVAPERPSPPHRETWIIVPSLVSALRVLVQP